MGTGSIHRSKFHVKISSIMGTRNDFLTKKCYWWIILCSPFSHNILICLFLDVVKETFFLQLKVHACKFCLFICYILKKTTYITLWTDHWSDCVCLLVIKSSYQRNSHVWNDNQKLTVKFRKFTDIQFSLLVFHHKCIVFCIDLLIQDVTE